MQATTVIEETHWLLDLAERHAFIRGVVGWVDLESPQLAQTLDTLQRRRKFKGVRHPVHDEAETDWLLRPAVINGLRELARRNIPYDLLMRPVHLPLIPRIAEAVPGLRMVLDHIGKPRIADQVFDNWCEDIAAAAKLSQLYCKMSGMITEADHENWTSADLTPYVEHILRSFNLERLMFGSDWPVCLLAGRWKQVLAAFTQSMGAQPVGVRERMLGLTAMEFYGLE